MYDLNNYSHPSEHVRNFVKTKKLELRARREARLLPINIENEKLTYVSLPSSPINILSPKIVNNFLL